MLWRSRRAILAVLLVLPLSPILIFMMDRAKDIIEDLSGVNSFIKNSQKDNVEPEKGRSCNISLLDPLSEDIAKFAEDLPTVTCEGTDWVNCYKSECNIAIAIQKTVKEIVCIYKDIVYVDDRNVYFGNPTTVIGNEKYMLNMSDHVKIDCTGKNMTRPDVRAHWSGFEVGFRSVPTKPVLDRKDSYNVMILCFDSTSRNGFIRKMRQSYEFMTKQLNAVILNGYNVVGNGTTGILYPILTGKSKEELNYQRKRSTKKKYIDTKKFIFHILKENGYNVVGNGTTGVLSPILTGKSEEELIYQKKWTTKKKYIDSKKFIFHILKENGYRTAYFEDRWISTNQNEFNRFRRQPTDHYLRTSLLADISKGENWNQGRPPNHCFGAKPQYQLMMNLADEFLQLDGLKFCITFVADVAYKNFTLLPTADETLFSFLQTLSARRALEDTLVVIIGDLRSRFSSIQKTTQGKPEERLPLMAILLPEKLKTRRPKALTSLKSNEDVLTTPFDIYATILDVLNLKTKNIRHLKAMSLLEPIPKSRSCGEAGVMPDWCVCAH